MPVTDEKFDNSDGGTSQPPQAISPLDFEQASLKSKGPVVVAFLASWSHPCSVLAAALDKVAQACGDHVRIVRLDADNYPDLSLVYDIHSVPTLLFFTQGTLLGRLVGTVTPEAILSRLNSLPAPHAS